MKTRDPLMLKVLSLNPCFDGADFLRQYDDFETAWTQTPNPAWLFWYLERVLPAETPIYVDTFSLLNEMIRLAGDYPHQEHSRYQIAVVQTHLPWETRMSMATQAMYDDSLLGKYAGSKQHFFATAVKIIRRQFPTPPPL